MTTGKTIALTRQTFVGKVMSLLFQTTESEPQITLSFHHKLQGKAPSLGPGAWQRQFYRRWSSPGPETPQPQSC